MIATELSARLRAAGVTQVQIAARLGYTPQAVYQALRKGDPRYRLLVEALEIMTPEQRERFLKG